MADDTSAKNEATDINVTVKAKGEQCNPAEDKAANPEASSSPALNKEDCEKCPSGSSKHCCSWKCFPCCFWKCVTRTWWGWLLLLVILVVSGLIVYFIVSNSNYITSGASECNKDFHDGKNFYELLYCEIDYSRKHADAVSVIDYTTSQIFIWMSIICGLLATVVTAGSKEGELHKRKYWIAFLAAVPVAMSSISTKLNFEERSRWDDVLQLGMQAFEAEYSEVNAASGVNATKTLGQFGELQDSYQNFMSCLEAVRPEHNGARVYKTNDLNGEGDTAEHIRRANKAKNSNSLDEKTLSTADECKVFIPKILPSQKQKSK